MQIRCYSCKMPISVGRAFVDQALNIIHEDDLVYYDFTCPKCRKSNRVSKKQLLHASPGWVYEPTEKVEEKKAEPKPTETKKTSAKKAPAKKTTAKKAPAKKAPTKKTDPKKKKN